MDHENPELISIIVPVYNGEQYIERCIKSIRAQTYQNIEIVIINDGSKDQTEKILTYCRQLDNRIKIINQVNQGVSNARNVGIKEATGQYIMFVDSDDYVEENYCNYMMSVIKEYDADMVISKALDRDKDCNLLKQLQPVPKCIKVYDSLEHYSFSSPYAHYVVWGVLYKKSRIEDLKFATDLYLAEDTLFFSCALKKCKKICIVPERFYNYIKYDESLSHGKINKKKMTELTAWQRVCELYKDREYTYTTCIEEYGICTLNMLNKLIIQTGNKFTEDSYEWVKLTQQIIKNNYSIILKKSGIKRKGVILTIVFFPSLYRWLYYFYMKLKRGI